MDNWLDETFTSRFRLYGTGARIEAGGQIYHPEFISIGSNVTIRASYWFNIVDASGRTPKIVIGDGSECEPGVIFSSVNLINVGRRVHIGANVNISDTDHGHEDIGIPVMSQRLTSTTGTVSIGDGAWIGPQSIVNGNVKIGRGSVVMPGSVVLYDVPDFCVAEGVPARIVRVYEPSSGDWVSVRRE